MKSRRQLIEIHFFTFLFLVLTACSAGGGGGSLGSGGAVPQLIKAPILSCGTKDCISGDEISSTAVNSNHSVGTMSSGRIVDLKASYETVKDTHVFQVKNLLNTFNTIADDEGLESCEDIPTAGSYADGPINLTFSASSESWNLDGLGLVMMNRKIYMTDDTSQAEIHLRCLDEKQFLHVIYKDGSSQFESFSIYNISSGEIVLQSAYISGTEKSMAYFVGGGNDVFELGYFSKGSTSQSSVLGKSFKNSNYDLSDTAVEYVVSDVLGEDLDSVAFGDAGTKIRGCALNYRDVSPTHYDYSCDPDDDPMNPTKYALLTSNFNLLGSSGSPAWNTTYLNSLTIVDPQ